MNKHVISQDKSNLCHHGADYNRSEYEMKWMELKLKSQNQGLEQPFALDVLRRAGELEMDVFTPQ